MFPYFHSSRCYIVTYKSTTQVDIGGPTTNDELFRRFLHGCTLYRSRFVAVFILPKHFPQEGYVADGKLQGVHLAQPFLVRKGWNVRSQALECFVDTLHSATLAEVGSLPLLRLLRGALRSTVLRRACGVNSVSRNQERRK